MSGDYFVIHRHVATSYKYGATRSNVIKMFRTKDDKIPVFSTMELAYRYLAGEFRPTGNASDRATRTITWPGHWKMTKHDWHVSKRPMKLTKVYILDPKHQNEPMEVA